MTSPGALIAGFALLAVALPASPASAQLGGLPVPALPALPIPPVTPPVVPTLPPVPVVNDVLEDVLGSGGPDLPTDETVTGILDQILGGGASSGGGTGGGNSTSGGSGSGSGTTPGTGTETTPGGTSGTPGGTSQGGGSTYGSTSSNDGRAPKLSFKILTKLGKAAKTGKLRLRVTSSEVAVVAVNGLLRPGKARRVNGGPLPVSRRLVRTKVAVVAFRKQGARTVTITVPKHARTSLKNSKTARLSLQAWASDVSRNQARKTVKRTITR